MRCARAMIVTAMLAGSAPAAPVEETIKEARRHYESGMAAFTLERYDDAIKEFEAGFLLKPDPTFLYNIGQAYRLSERPRQAINYYRKYLGLQPEARNRAELEERIRSMSEVLAASNKPPQSVVPPDSTASSPAPSPSPGVAAAPAETAAEVKATPAVATAATAVRKPLARRPAFWGAVGVAAAVVIGGGVAIGVVVATSPTDPTPSFGTFKGN